METRVVGERLIVYVRDGMTPHDYDELLTIVATSLDQGVREIVLSFSGVRKPPDSTALDAIVRIYVLAAHRNVPVRNKGMAASVLDEFGIMKLKKLLEVPDGWTPDRYATFATLLALTVIALIFWMTIANR